MRWLPSLRAILIMLVALQVVSMAPVSMAMSMAAASAASADCEGHQGGAADCPCCPEALELSDGCGTLCLAAFAPPPAAAPLCLLAALSADPGSGSSAFSSQAYSPVNPPPIR